MIASLLGLLVALGTGCASRAPILIAGGAGQEGSGLGDARAPTKMQQLLSAPGPQIVVVELRGEALAGRAVKAGDRFAPAQTFELRSGSALLRLPGDRQVSVAGPARLRFTEVDGFLAPMLEAGQIEAASAGRLATPSISSLACDGAWKALRDGNQTTFECGKGALRWQGASDAIALAGESRWSIDEGKRAHAGR